MKEWKNGRKEMNGRMKNDSKKKRMTDIFVV